MTEGGVCTVNYVTTHVGHHCELGHLRLTQQEREQIASKIAVRIPMSTILDEVRSSICDQLERLHLLSQKDLQNIERSFNLNCNIMRHQDDWTSVNAWVHAMQDSDNSCVLFYKPQGEEYRGLNRDDFVLLLMNDAQRGMLEKYGNDCLCMDSTHGLNSYGFELVTVLVLDDLRQGFLCAFMLSNRTDQTVVTLFLNHIFRQTETITPEVFMSDMAEAFYNSWCEVMGPPKKRLFCAWHVDRAWRKNLTKIKTSEKQVEMYKLVRTIMQERDPDTFSILLNEGLKIMNNDPDTAEFGNYFQNSYVSCKELWAYCYRVHTGLNTNMHLERMHGTIRHIYLQGKNVKRLDKALHAIMTFVRDKLIDRLVILHKGKVTSKISHLRHRHKKKTFYVKRCCITKR
ncbi:uncharacterized protein [Anabrus simplex]|uniref:uncharacterized protein n=1 Tax=Anabrus simplex TaxID=316456 RepID=UPI0035A3C1B8